MSTQISSVLVASDPLDWICIISFVFRNTRTTNSTLLNGYKFRFWLVSLFQFSVDNISFCGRGQSSGCIVTISWPTERTRQNNSNNFSTWRQSVVWMEEMEKGKPQLEWMNVTRRLRLIYMQIVLEINLINDLFSPMCRFFSCLRCIVCINKLILIFRKRCPPTTIHSIT
jgi:hypothetical protein